MKKSLATVLLLAAAACGTESTAPAAVAVETHVATANANGVSSPNTAVQATVVVRIDGTRTYRTSGPGNNGKGECVAEGAWRNAPGKPTSEKAHPNCLSTTDGRALTITFAETANYVLPTSGNVQLNFAPDCTLAANPLVSCGRGLQYKKNADATVGSGRIVTTEASSGEWTIDFAHAVFNNTSNLIIRTGTAVVACNATFGCHPGSMTW